MGDQLKIQPGPLPLRNRVSREDEDQKLREAARLYEKHFLAEMVKAMRKTVDHSQMTEPSMAENIYRDQLDEQYVEAWSNTGGVGFGDVIYQQLKEKFHPAIPLPKPEGPLPLESQDKARVLNLKKTEPTSLRESSFLFEVPGVTDVVAPWGGKVQDLIASDDGRNTLRVKSDGNFSFLLSFKGHLNSLDRGADIEPGQKLGRILSAGNSLVLQVSQGVQEVAKG